MPSLFSPHAPFSTLAVMLAFVAFLTGAVVSDLKHTLSTMILVLLSYLASILIIRKNRRRFTTRNPDNSISGYASSTI